MINGNDEYAEKWSVSANHLLSEGVYEWVAERFSDYDKVLEIGCGAGQSTFVLVATGHSVFAIDKNATCIANCKKYIEDNDFSAREITIADKPEYTNSDVTLLNLDLLDENVRFLRYLNPDVVILWNPGGWTAHRDNFQNASDRQWDMIEEVIRYAESKGIPFSILNRFSNQCEAQGFWKEVAETTDYQLLYTENKLVDMSCVDGIPLITENGEIKEIVYSYGFFSRKD